MKLSHFLLGLACVGSASTTACTAGTTDIDERSSAILTEEDLAILDGADETASCKWHCKACGDEGNCESECFPVGNCESKCGFTGVCLPGYSWSDDECTCVEDQEAPAECGFTAFCKAGWVWDESVCNCVPDGFSVPVQ